VNRFADLLDMLAFTPSRNAKLALLQEHFRTVPDPERGYALAALTRDLDIPAVKPAQLRALISERMDPELFGYAYDYVGDLAETIALAWPERHSRPSSRNDAPGLTEVVETLLASSRAKGPGLVEGWLDRLDAPGRYALLKLVTGGFRMGLSGRLIKQALAGFGNVHVNEIEELWHGLAPPYLELFAWLEGSGDKPVNAAAAPFRPVMLSHAIDEADFEKLDPANFVAEWKWDGIRVQATSERGVNRLYSRTGDDISATFPDLLDAFAFDGALDGELLVARPVDGGLEIGSFSDLQQRLNRKTVSAKQLREGVMIKRADSAYVPGRPKGPWWKWKRDPMLIDAVLMYAQRGHGKRSSLYSDYTFGVWKEDGEGRMLVPVGKAYFGFTDDELKKIDSFVRKHTVNRFGPVREVIHGAGCRHGVRGGVRRPATLNAAQERDCHALSAHFTACAGTSRQSEADTLET
jgi:ATP-dependent DNA ligase